MKRYKIIFKNGEHMLMACADGVHPIDELAKWNDPLMNGDTIKSSEEIDEGDIKIRDVNLKAEWLAIEQQRDAKRIAEEEAELEKERIRAENLARIEQQIAAEIEERENKKTIFDEGVKLAKKMLRLKNDE